MKKEMENALNNLWIVVREAKMSGQEHDQLRNDFIMIKEALESLAPKVEKMPKKKK